MQTSAERGSNEASNCRPSDRELISRFLAARDESAFAGIVTRYSRLVMSVALHTLRDPHAAEDAFQATFLVLARSARRIRNRDSLASWLHGTAYRVSRRLLRTRLRRKEQDLPIVELTAPIWADPERPDEQAALDEELARLAEGLRGPLVLHYLEGRTVPEIAAELRMTQSAVEGRLKRGKKTLRKRLLKRGVLLSSAAFGAGSTLPAEAGAAGALVSATVAACLRTTASATLTPIATSTIQQIALQETAAMTRIALLKTALACGGVAGAIGLAGAGANGTLGTAWARPSGNAVATDEISSQIEPDELPIAPAGVIQTALVQTSGETSKVVREADLTTAPNSAPPDFAVQLDSNPDVDQATRKSQAVQARQKELKLKTALDQKTSLMLHGQSLLEAAQFLSGQFGIDIQLDPESLKTVGVSTESEVDIEVKSVALGDAFALMLKSVKEGKLTYEIDGGVLRIVGDTPQTDSSDGPRLNLVGRRSAEDEQQINALEATVKALQIQVDQIREDRNQGRLGQNEKVFPTGASGTPSAGSGSARRGSAGHGSASGGKEVGGGAAGANGAVTFVTPPRPRSVDDALESIGRGPSMLLREYLTTLERNAQATARPAAPVQGSTGGIREFRPQHPTEDRIRQSLDHLVDFQFTGQSLQEVMNYLSTQENLNIRIDTTALTNAGVGPDNEINLVISGISLRAALKLMLKDVGGTPLDYVIEDEVMTITTKEKADETLQTVIYDLSSLGIVSAPISTILEKTVEPASWEPAGGKGTIVPVDNSVIITTSRRLHDKTSEIMQMLQQHAQATQQ